MGTTRRAIATTLAVLSSLALAGCGTSKSAGSKWASSWVSAPSQVAAMRLTLKIDGARASGSLDGLLTTTAGTLSALDVSYTGVTTTKGLSLHFGDDLGTATARLVHGHLLLSVRGVAGTEEFAPGTRASYRKLSSRVRLHSEYLGFQTATNVTGQWLTRVAGLSTKLATFAPNVLGADVSVLEQDAQQEQTNLAWVQANVGGSFSTFICIGYTGAAQTQQQAKSTYAGFTSDVATGDGVSSQLNQALGVLESKYSLVQADEAQWHFTTGTVSASEVDLAQSNASNIESGWPASVSQYSSEASSYMTQVSELAAQAESTVTASTSYGC
ncbi:MAG: hypothetical protein ACYDEH_12190 [Acidimicrobiales bacterium]